MIRHSGLTSDHDSADVCSAKVFQHCCGFCFQLVLHDDQTQKLHVGLNVVSSFKERMKAKISTKRVISSKSLERLFWKLEAKRIRRSSALPVDVLDFVPCKFRFKSAVSESYDPEALLGVAFQNIGKIFWHLKNKDRSVAWYNQYKEAVVTMCFAQFLSFFSFTCFPLTQTSHHLWCPLHVGIHAFLPEQASNDTHPLESWGEGKLADDANLICWLWERKKHAPYQRMCLSLRSRKHSRKTTDSKIKCTIVCDFSA